MIECQTVGNETLSALLLNSKMRLKRESVSKEEMRRKNFQELFFPEIFDNFFIV